MEELLGLKHPRKVLIDEALEVPRNAERIFRGIYTEPEKLKRGFAELQRETGSMAELLGLRRAKLRDWAGELPASPREAQEYILATVQELKAKQERADMAEARILALLQEHEDIRLFPLEEESLGKWSAERIVLFPKVIDKLASIFKVPSDHLTKVMLVHFMLHVLIYAGEDRDKRNWSRHELNGEGLELFVHYFARLFFTHYQYKELSSLDVSLAHSLAPAGRDLRELDGFTREQIHAVLLFWRRKSDLTFAETLLCLHDFT
ncbi:MAG: hypothetical protein M0Z55_08705 [Peptococcaceae bacterium]|nr:hypothetical protein [Peptococcaceae bacterium]